MAAPELTVIAFVTDAPLGGRVDTVLRGSKYTCTRVGSSAEVRRLLIEDTAPAALVADAYDAGLVALAPALPWVWIADPYTRFDRGVVLSPEHLDELPQALAASINLARCELALRLFRRRPTRHATNDAPATRTSSAFEMHFQPRWSMSGERIVGAEALLRWHGLDPNLGTEQLISSRDLPLVRLGDWILERTLQHLTAFRPLWPSDAVMTMNVSVAQLGDPRFGELVAERLRAHAIPPNWLELDVDVEALGALGSTHVANLLSLRASGIGVAADGVGYRQFDPGRFAHLPLTGLKLDRHLIAGLPARAHAVALTRRVIELARRLSLNPVGIGVETPDQLAVLRSADCSAFQGFLLAEPMPPDELHALLAAHRESRGGSFTEPERAPIVAP